MFVPLFALWFMLWDEKKYRQSERRRHHDDPFYQESYYSSRHSLMNQGADCLFSE